METIIGIDQRQEGIRLTESWKLPKFCGDASRKSVIAKVQLDQVWIV